MTRPLSWKRLLAVPAVLSLALGGALLTAAPAQAAPGDALVVTTPAEGAVAGSRVVTVSGTGSDGAGLSIQDLDDGVTAATTVAVGGAWTTTVAYPDTATTAQGITVTQVIEINDPSSVTTVVRNFTLPPVTPAPADPLVLTGPADGDVIDSRFVDFEGTADPGATVTATVAGEEGYGSIFADEFGDFSFQGYFPFELGNSVTVDVTATATDGTVSNVETVTLDLLVPIAAPVIVSPTTGASIAGTSPTSGTVMFRGTGVPGQTVVVLVLPNDEATLAKFGDIDPLTLIPNVVVPASGQFSVSTTLPLGSYAAAAVHNETPIDSVDSEILSLPSNEVAFTLVAPAAPAATLPATGAVSAGFAGPAGALLLAGLLLVVASRRRANSLPQL